MLKKIPTFLRLLINKKLNSRTIRISADCNKYYSKLEKAEVDKNTMKDRNLHYKSLEKFRQGLKQVSSRDNDISKIKTIIESTQNLDTLCSMLNESMLVKKNNIQDVYSSLLVKILENSKLYTALATKTQAKIFYNFSKYNLEDENINKIYRVILNNFWNQIKENLSDMNLREIIMFFWASVKSDIDLHTQLKVMEMLLTQIHQMNHFDLSSFLYSLVKFSEKPSTNKKFNEILISYPETKEAVKRKISIFMEDPIPDKIIANLIWSLEKLKILDDETSTAVQKFIISDKISFENNNFRIIVNSINNNCSISEEFSIKIQQEFVKRIDSLNTSEIFSLLRILLESNKTDLESLIFKNEQGILSKLSQNPQLGVPSFLFCLATLNLNKKDWIEVSLNHGKNCLKKFRAEDFGIIAYSLTVLKHFDSDFYLYAIEELKKLNMKIIGTSLLYQVNQVFFELLYNPDLKNRNLVTHETFQTAKRILYDKVLNPRYTQFKKLYSPKHFDIHYVFQHLGISFIPEYALEIYNIDIALNDLSKERVIKLKEMVKNNKSFTDAKNIQNLSNELQDVSNIQPNIFLEIDGETHFKQKSQLRKGGSELKLRQLGYLSHKIINITQEKCSQISKLTTINQRALALLDYIESQI